MHRDEHILGGPFFLLCMNVDVFYNYTTSEFFSLVRRVAEVTDVAKLLPINLNLRRHSTPTFTSVYLLRRISLTVPHND